ncbi:MAG: cupin-like domain-containing protein, partial [Olpidium bornovanus]
MTATAGYRRGACRSGGRLRASTARGRRRNGPACSSTNAVPAGPRFRNDCKGFRPPPRWMPARVAVGGISPEDFYRRYVATRTPCVLTTAAGDPTSASKLLGKPPPRWSLDELKDRAGHVAVKVESKGSRGSFGKGTSRQKMLFADFLDAVARQGRTDLYLTTQYQDEEQPDAEVDASGEDKKAELRWKAHAYCQAPLSALLGDIELRPPLFGKLVPQQVNLWLGAVPAGDDNGTSSGLHHDFHDNLYVLLRGRKRFTLFSPHDAGRLYLYGRLSHVHPNGLINYRGAETRSDGANPLYVARWRSKTAVQRLAAAEAAGEDAAVAEEELEQAMDALLDVDCLGEESPGQLDDGGLLLGNARKRKRRLDVGGTAPPKKIAVAGSVETGSSEPPSFSKIPACALHCPKKLEPFPLLSGARKFTCDLREGDILYLPATGETDHGPSVVFRRLVPRSDFVRTPRRRRPDPPERWDSH